MRKLLNRRSSANAYLSLNDPHLDEYYSDPQRRNHLIKVGLLTKDGCPVDETSFKKSELRQRRETVQTEEQLRRAVEKRHDLETQRRLLCARTVQDIENIEKVLHVKMVRNNNAHSGSTAVCGGKDGRVNNQYTILPTPPPPRHSSPGSAARGRHRKTKRSTSAPATTPRRTALASSASSEESDWEGLHFDDTVDTKSDNSGVAHKSFKKGSKRRFVGETCHVVTINDGNRRNTLLSDVLNSTDDDTSSITELERKAGLKRATLVDYSHEDATPAPGRPRRRRRSVSPYLLRPLSGPWRGAMGGRGVTLGPVWRGTSASVSRSSAYAKCTACTATRHGRHHGITVGDNLAHETMEKWEPVEVTMRYHGDTLNVDYERDDPTDEITVEQQHCGGNTLNVFQGKVLPGEEFTFMSHRHPGYPFSLTVHVNGKKDSRVSTCCEYKHTRNARLGGKGGHFSIARRRGAGPCRKCLLRMLKRGRGKSANTHDYYALQIPVDGERRLGDVQDKRGIHHATHVISISDHHVKNDGGIITSRSANEHDYYPLKVSVEDGNDRDNFHRQSTQIAQGWNVKPGGNSAGHLNAYRGDLKIALDDVEGYTTSRGSTIRNDRTATTPRRSSDERTISIKGTYRITDDENVDNFRPKLYYQILNFGMIISSALMIWKGLMLVSESESPIVVVLSGSMEPAFYRGDLLFLTNHEESPIRVGEIVVFKVEGREIPIVHRVLRAHETENGTLKFLTKGDNNQVDDRGLYAPGQIWLSKKDVVGRAKGYIPYVGIVTILMNDYPKFKYLTLAVLGVFVLIHRE